MKTEQQKNQSWTFQQTKNTFQSNKPILCFNGKESLLVCQNEKCQKYAFMCLDKTCGCRHQHEGCISILTESLINAITKKAVSSKSIEKIILIKIDNVIDQLSQLRERITREINQKYTYLGLSGPESDVLNALLTGRSNNICGKKIQNVKFILKNKQNRNISMNEIQANINKIFARLKKEIQIDYDKILSELKKVSHIESIGFKNFIRQSKLIKSQIDIQKLQAFFSDQPVKSAKLLYRASQNNFDTIKFQQVSHLKQNTLTILETQFKKVIGGFSPLPWDKTKQPYQDVVDDSQKSFLYSLTQNHRFPYSKHKGRAIYRSNGSNIGPAYGNGTDLYIINKANQNSNSFSNINRSYTNPEYNYNDFKSWEKFTGSPTGRFKIKEWEVWQIQFEEN